MLTIDNQDYIASKNAVYDKLTELGFNLDRVVFLSLKGSQNYNLDIYNENYQSDFDYIALVIPTIEDLYFNHQTSKTYDYEYGQVDVKDVRLVPELLGKMNSSFLEIFVSKYSVGEKEFKEVKDLIPQLIEDRKPLFLKSLMGLLVNKEKDLCHEYPIKKDILSKYGYDPKQLQHAYRYFDIMNEIDKGNPYEKVLFYEDKDPKRYFQLKIKESGIGDVEIAKASLKALIDNGRRIEAKYWQDSKPSTPIVNDTKDKISQLMFELTQRKLKK